MPDITMCTGDCPVKEYCYRYMAKPNEYYQTYSSLEEICIPNGYSELIPYKENIERDNKKYEINYTLDDFLLDEIHKNTKETN